MNYKFVGAGFAHINIKKTKVRVRGTINIAPETARDNYGGRVGLEFILPLVFDLMEVYHQKRIELNAGYYLRAVE